MSEMISGGIMTASKANRKGLLERLKQLMSEKKKASVRISRSDRKSIAATYRRWCKEELCCLPSKEELREAERLKKGKSPKRSRRG